MDQIDQEIQQGSFQYEKYFPDSKNVGRFSRQVFRGLQQGRAQSNFVQAPLFKDFAEEWFLEREIAWKISYQRTMRDILNKYLIPRFGNMVVSSITKGDILKFRSSLAKVPSGKKIGLSPERINHIMTPLRQVLGDAADRFQFTMPFVGIKPLKVPKTDVNPFTLEEVNFFLSKVRADFRAYYTVRFFTAMRTGEIDGLQWKYVDFNRREILIREILVQGRIEDPKTAGSVREISMSQPVYEALKAQWEITGQRNDFVFCTRAGTILSHNNITKRIWYPTLKYLGLKKRRPYQTRHTMATLWLAAGENLEWIARQMGHTSTEMLFTVYSRFVPNLTRRDGSAFENLLTTHVGGLS